MFNNMSNVDKYMDALSNLIKNPALSVKEIFGFNNRVVVITTQDCFNRFNNE
ncbi:hypothetical protein NOX90_03460 [Wolbachia endosymbiont of Anurida maritima]|uniref:hypothetical protein n=1 Tax=Wolbachia endosymbiont of Anurida maritima TaxID=2850562 RepID=UPI0035D0A963